MEEPLLHVVVYHEPQQVGSKQAFVVYKKPKHRKIPMRRPDGSIIVNVTDENAAAKPFMNAVNAEARSVYRDPPVEGVGFDLEVIFYLKRPETHWGTGRNAHLLKPSAPARPTTYPDEDKLLRAAQDALEGIVWKNDSQVIRAIPEKRYAVPTREGDGLRAEITIRRHAFQRAEDLPMEEQTRYVRARERDEDEGQPSLLESAA